MRGKAGSKRDNILKHRVFGIEDRKIEGVNCPRRMLLEASLISRMIVNMRGILCVTTCGVLSIYI